MYLGIGQLSRNLHPAGSMAMFGMTQQEFSQQSAFGLFLKRSHHHGNLTAYSEALFKLCPVFFVPFTQPRFQFFFRHIPETCGLIC